MTFFYISQKLLYVVIFSCFIYVTDCDLVYYITSCLNNIVYIYGIPFCFIMFYIYIFIYV